LKVDPFLAAVLFVSFESSGAVRAGANPRELGAVHWGQDVDAALAEAARSGRPVLVLFQEIPGCGTCVGFGQGPLSHPLLVEAIETEFIPVAVYNNKPEHAPILERFSEPAWNNPVMRFLSARGGDLLVRREGIWSTHAVALRLLEALRAAGRPVPPYLDLTATETDEGGRQTAVFGVHCFWEGEVRLGGLDGVLATEAGFLDGREVVSVEFDGGRVKYGELVARAAELGCANPIYAGDDWQWRTAREVCGVEVSRPAGRVTRAPEKDQKFHLKRSPLAGLDATPLQQARMNSALARGEDPRAWLSPRQRARAEQLARRDR
jgi:hypothetical protein